MEKREVRTLQKEGKSVTYTLIRSSKRRYSMSLGLDREKKPYLRASLTLPDSKADAFVLANYERLLSRFDKPEPFDERGYWLLGSYVEDPGFFALSEAKRQKIYRKAMEEYLLEAFPRLERQMAAAPGMTYTPKKMRGSFGIYHRKSRAISLSTTLAPYAGWVIDSVIAHELTHDVYLGHGKRFYAKLLKGFPRYYEARKKLREHDYAGRDPLEK